LTLAAFDARLPAASAATQYTFTWQDPLEAGATLDVRNLYGRIAVTQARGGKASVNATVTSQRGDARAVKINLARVGKTVYVCPVYPGETAARDCSNRGNTTTNTSNDASVVFAIQLPKDVNLVARSVNGPIDARGLASNVNAQSVNEDITISTSGTASAKAANGAIDATFGARTWAGTLAFEAVNGRITVRLPRKAAFTLQAQTLNGSLDVNGFPVAKSSGFVGRNAGGTVGSGGGKLSLKTVNGSIRLSAN
jgi:hypothetical protein